MKFFERILNLFRSKKVLGPIVKFETLNSTYEIDVPGSKYRKDEGRWKPCFAEQLSHPIVGRRYWIFRADEKTVYTSPITKIL